MTASKKSPLKRLEEFKFIVQPVFLEYEDGKPPVDIAADPVIIGGGTAGLREWCDGFPAALAALAEERNKPQP